jgi:hypothetical protein
MCREKGQKGNGDLMEEMTRARMIRQRKLRLHPRLSPGITPQSALGQEVPLRKECCSASDLPYGNMRYLYWRAYREARPEAEPEEDRSAKSRESD